MFTQTATEQRENGFPWVVNGFPWVVVARKKIENSRKELKEP